MAEYKVLFLDIDGTILTAENKIENSAKDAISQIQEQGIEIFLSTGRPIHELDKISRELGIQSFIGYNGAYTKYKNKDIFQEPMSDAATKYFFTIANQYHHEVAMYTNSKNIFTNLNSTIVQEFIKTFHLHKNEIYSPGTTPAVLGMTLINVKDDEVVHYSKEKGIHLSQVNVDGMRHCYDVIRDNVNKGFGVQMVLKHLGIEKEASIAFGDGMNDKEMLMSVGEGFAMGNSHPDLFQFAKHKTTEVNNSGIFNGLKKLGLVN